MTLTFNTLRQANKERTKKWHKKGLNDWSVPKWTVALVAEVGEFCSDINNLNRIRDGIIGSKKTEEELKNNLGKELADIVIYVDLLATRLDIDLSLAVKNKFNETSIRYNFPNRL